MKKIVALLFALIMLLSVVPLSALAAPKELIDDCKTYGKIFEKSSNFEDMGGGWEYGDDGKTNRWNPHPTTGLPCFGKKKGYREWITYKFEKTTSFELHFHCAYDDKGTYLIKPIYEYDDKPLLAGAIIEVSEDNKTWTKIKLKELEGKQIGNKDSANNYYWVDYTVTPAEALPAKSSYFRITLGQDAAWSMFIGSVKLTDDPAASAASAASSTAPESSSEPESTPESASVESDVSSVESVESTGSSITGTNSNIESKNDKDASTDGLSTPIVVGIAVAAVVIIAVAIVLIVVLSKKKKSGSQ